MRCAYPPYFRAIIAAAAVCRPLLRLNLRLLGLFQRIPDGLVAFLGRFSVAATFWQAGQTKVDGLVVHLIRGRVELGLPRLSESAVDLFRYE